MLETEPFRCETKGACVVELPPKQLLVLRIKTIDDGIIAGLSATLGCVWPLAPNTIAQGVCDVLWLGPNEWLLAGGPVHLSETVGACCNEHVHHLSDTTDGRITFRAWGQEVYELLARGCSLDLHDRAFSPGRCAQTLVAQVPTLIFRLSPEPTFDLTFDISFGPYLKAWFADACASPLA